jgi:hypothetical protein
MFVSLANGNTQNLIPNGGFEDVNTCPTVPSNIDETDFWYSNYPSPDFYHSCGAPYMDVPSNSAGYQDASTGNGYAGAYAWPLNELLQVELADYLIAGHVYEASFVVNMIDNAQYALSGLGMYLSSTDTPPTNVDGELLVTPQISNASGSPITNTTGWETISGTFVADGTELYVTIGRFGLIADANLTQEYPLALWSLSYYNYDDIILTDLTILPVELIDFTGQVNERDVYLNWSTASEMNSESFVIERSFDGVEYEEIGLVEAQGNSQSQKSYSFLDRTAQTGLVYYQLRQTDTNGSSEIYGPIAVEISHNIDLTISPNPCSSTCRIRTNVPLKNGTIEVISSRGQIVSELVLEASVTQFETASLSNGIYHVLIRQNSQIIAAEKLVISK